MAYTTIDNPELYFQNKLYTGNGSTQSITLDGSENMSPNMVWLKIRTQAYSHRIFDSVRGANKRIHPDTNEAEDSPTTALTSFDSDGFSLGNNTGENKSGDTFVAWNWKAGTSFSNDASSTGVGSIDSTGSISTDAGFAIISWVGTGVDATIAHGLGSAPKIVFVKNRSTTDKWRSSFTALDGSYDYMHLNTTESVSNEPVSAPTSSVFSVYSHAQSNGNGNNMIAYVFSEKKGYSKFSSYTGNASTTNGTFVYTGFKPAWVLTKSSSNASTQWTLKDNKRNTFNPCNASLYPNLNAAEDSDSNIGIDFLSNGFKLYGNYSGINANGYTYIYMAFAEAPFVNSNGVPNNAR